MIRRARPISGTAILDKRGRGVSGHLIYVTLHISEDIMHTPLYGGIRDSIRSIACLLLLVSSVPGLAQGQLNTPFEDLNLVVRPPDAPLGHANDESRELRLEGALDHPVGLLYGSLFGGDGWDEGTAFDESPDGIICLTAYTNSVLPGLANNDGFDVLVGCFDPESKLPLFIDTFGGAGEEYSTDLKIKGDNVFVVGATASATLPGTSSGFQSESGGQGDCFLATWSIEEKMLKGSTFFGGTAADGCNGLSVDTDAVFVTGTTFGELPGTEGFLDGPRGESDAFVAGFSLDLSTLRLSELLGSDGDDTGVALEVVYNPMGDASAWGAGPGEYGIFVAGTAGGPGFPTTSNAAQSTFAGEVDGFVVSYAYDPFANGLSMKYGSYLGGGGTRRPG